MMYIETKFLNKSIKLFLIAIILLLLPVFYIFAAHPTPSPSSESYNEANVAHELTIATTETSTSSSEDTAVLSDTKETPEVRSQTFLDPNAWYSETEGVFTWTLPFDVTAVAVELSDSPENIPEENEDAITKPPVEEFLITGDIVIDGVQYVSINFKNSDGWGEATNRKLQIDTISPEPFDINVREGISSSSFPLLNFEANDITSGIEHYEVSVADQRPTLLTPDEAKFGYWLSDLENGTYPVKITASDKAGNKRESNVMVLITADWIKPIEAGSGGLFRDFLTPSNLFIFFLLVVIALLMIYFLSEQKRLMIKEEKLRHEIREIQVQMEKIFSALRDEIYEQIISITKRKSLSAKEKKAIEDLTQALEVSETLIEKEINDVKSLLK